MKVLVTGAGGFIGSHLVEDQLKRGREVVAMDLRPGYLEKNTSDSRVRLVLGNVTDIEAFKNAVSGVDLVFHLASAHLEVGLNEDHYRSVNVRALAPILEASRQAGVKRFVHCSSVGVYGDIKNGPADEQTPCHPTNHYERTKLEGEKEVLEFYRETKFPIAVIRPAWVFGPRCPRTRKLLSAIGKGRFLMMGRGDNLRHPVYITDMIEAFELAANSPAAVGEIFVIGAEHSVTTRELVQAMRDATGSRKPLLSIPLWLGRILAAVTEIVFGILRKQPPLSRRTLAFFENNNSFNISKAKKVLNFHPQHDLISGLRETVAGLSQPK